MNVLLLYNQPVLASDHPDRASEEGVLETVEAVTAALVRAGDRVQRFAVQGDLRQLLDGLEAARADVIFNLCEGLHGAGAGEAHVAAVLELYGVPFTGAGADSLSLVRDKARTKWLLKGAGLPTADFYLIGSGDDVPLSLPNGAPAELWFVKPAREDASLGISEKSVVALGRKLHDRVQAVQARYGDVLVERYLPGREFNQGLVALAAPRALPLAEIEFGNNLAWPIVTYDAKWSESSADFAATPVRCPTDADPAIVEQMQQLALMAFRLTGCRDYARVDFRLDEAGKPCILEVNANPDLSPAAGLARAWRVSGGEYDELAVEIARQALGRGRHASSTR